MVSYIKELHDIKYYVRVFSFRHIFDLVPISILESYYRIQQCTAGTTNQNAHISVYCSMLLLFQTLKITINYFPVSLILLPSYA